MLARIQKSSTCHNFLVKMTERVTVGEVFLKLNLDQNVRIIDIACGTGAVAEDIATKGYTNIDGLDPMKGYLEVAKSNNLYKNYFGIPVDPGVELPIETDTYDVMLCCAGFFKGLMSPFVLPELLRITKVGGILMWNIAENYAEIAKDFEKYDFIVDDLIARKKWEHFRPIEKFEKLVFTDSGSAYLGGYGALGLDACGFIYCMRKLS